MWWWQRAEATVVEKSLLEEYGNVARWNGALGVRSFLESRSWGHCYTDNKMQEERLWIADPKAVHHILQASSYEYEKPPHNKVQREMLVDKGLASVEGEPTLTLHVVRPL